MSRIGSLRVMIGALVTLTFFYALALFIVLLIGYLVGVYIYSLFGNDLFTQEIYFFLPGMFIIIISGVIDLIASIVMIGIRFWLKSTIKEVKGRDFNGKDRILYSILAGLMVVSFIVAGIIIFEWDEEFFFLSFWAGVLFVFFILRWKVIDIPAKALGLLGNDRGLRWGRISAIPLVILVFSFLPLILSFRFEDAPTTTIVLVYLEVLFVLSVLINLVNIGGVVHDLSMEIGNQKRKLKSDP